VPCDTVSNLILAAAVSAALQPKPCISLYHVSSSQKNPVTITIYKNIMLSWVRRYPFFKMVFEPKITMIADKKLWRIYRFLDEELPTKAMQIFASLPLVGSK
jgi:hypothetical protein